MKTQKTKLKPEVLVTIADKKRIRYVKQLFFCAHKSGGWTGNYMLFYDNLSAKETIWFKKRGIFLKKCKPILNRVGKRKGIHTLKFYLFTREMKKWKKVLYLDTDIIIEGSLAKLTQVKTFTACRDIEDQPIFDQLLLSYKKNWDTLRRVEDFMKTKYSLTKPSFNAGVLAFDTKVIKKDTFFRLSELISISKNICLYADQSVLNLYFYKKWKILSRVYNLRPFLYLNKYKIDFGALRAIIFHFTGEGPSDKPWGKKNLFYPKWKQNLDASEQMDFSTYSNNRSPISNVSVVFYAWYLKLRCLLFSPIDHNQIIYKAYLSFVFHLREYHPGLYNTFWKLIQKGIFKKTTLQLVVVIEIIIIIFLGYYTYQKKTTTKGVTFSLTPIAKSDVNITETNGLKYFYEHEPNMDIKNERKWLGKLITYTINEDTLNDRYNYQIEKPEGTYRIIALGDSFTFGLNVNTKDNWTELLEDKLNSRNICPNIGKYEVLNLGMGGYGVEYIATRYQKRGSKYNPDIIIWLESGSGFNRVNELLQPLVEKYQSELSSEELEAALNQGDYLAWNKAYEELYRSYSYTDLLNSVDDSWQEFFDERNDTKVLLATFSFLPKKEIKMLSDYAKGQKNVLYFDNFSDIRKNDLQFLDGHPSEKGHEMIAEKLFKYLTGLSKIPCK